MQFVAVRSLVLFLAAPIAAPSAFPQVPVSQETAPAASPEPPARLAWSDVDRDGRADALVVGLDGAVELFWNAESGGLERATDALGLGDLPPAAGASWVDVDLDGDEDLVLVTRAGGVHVRRNDGGRLFPDVTALAGLPAAGVLEARWLDFDGAHGLDLVTRSGAGAAVHRSAGDGTFEALALPFDASLAPAPLLAPRAFSTALPVVEVRPAGTDAGDGAPPATTGLGPKATGVPFAPSSLAGDEGPDDANSRRPPAPSPGFEVLEALASGVVPFCAESLLDVATGACLQASSTPTLGALFPLSTTFNLNGKDLVGIGTTSSSAKLHVDAGANAATALLSEARSGFVAGEFRTAGAGVPGVRVLAGDLAAELGGRLEVGAGGGASVDPRAVVLADALGAGRLQLLSPTGGLAADLRAAESAGDGAQLELWNVAGTSTVRLDADGVGQGGFLQLDQASGLRKAQLRATDPSTPGALLEMNTSAGTTTVHLVSEEAAGDGAQLDLRTAGGVSTFRVDADLGSTSSALAMFERDGTETVQLLAEETAGTGAQLVLRKGDGTAGITLDADEASTSVVTVNSVHVERDDGTTTLALRSTDASTPGSELELRSSGGALTAHLVSEETAGTGAQLALGLGNGTTTFQVDADSVTTAAELSMYTRSGQETVEIVSEETPGTGAQIVLRKADGTAGITLDAEQGADARVTTETLQITGGADLVELFALAGDATGAAPGTVLVADPAEVGALTPSSAPYDRRVVGVVSGAGGVKPGIALHQADMFAGTTPVALTGRVHVLCTDENGPVRAGDLLTTSSTPGHAMRADDPVRAFGAVLGKALGRRDPRTGLVLVLVALQ